MTISVVFSLVILPMHDEMDKHSLEKDILIHSHTVSHINKKGGKFNLGDIIPLINILTHSNHNPGSSEPFNIISSFLLLNSLSSTILRL
jgi:hypothetical protein